MAETENSHTIQDAYRAVAEWIVRGLGQPPQWPHSALEWLYYQSRFVVKEYYRTIKKLEKTKSLADIARLLQYPASITHWLYFPESNFGHRKEYWADGLSREEGVDFIEKTIGIIATLRAEDSFCRDFKNSVFGSATVEHVLHAEKFIAAREHPEMPALLSSLNTVLWHYVMLIQGGQRIYSVELHGPYSLRNGDILFVREYAWLRPTGTWPFTEKFPFQKLVFYEIYRDLKINIDMFGHYWTSEHPYPKLVSIAISVDDRRNLEFSEIGDVYRRSAETLEDGNAVIRNFTRQDWIRKWLELSFLAIKPLKDALGEDHSPPLAIEAVARDQEEARKAAESGLHHVQLVAKAIRTLPKEKAVEKIASMHLKSIYHQWGKEAV